AEDAAGERRRRSGYTEPPTCRHGWSVPCGPLLDPAKNTRKISMRARRRRASLRSTERGDEPSRGRRQSEVRVQPRVGADVPDLLIEVLMIEDHPEPGHRDQIRELEALAER